MVIVMESSPTSYDFLENPRLISRLNNGTSLVLFGTCGLIVDGLIQDATLRTRIENLRNYVPKLKVWQLFDNPDELTKTAKKINDISVEVSPRILFIPQTKSELESSHSHAFAMKSEIDWLLMADRFLVLVQNAIQINFQTLQSGFSDKVRLPHSPIEKILSDEMRESGIDFQSHVSIDHYVLDFLVDRYGQRLVVEADGREFHDPVADTERDRIILERHGLKTLRFTGSQIVLSPSKCVKKILSYFDESTTPLKNVPDELTLDCYQAMAVDHGKGHARVLAPAGSGKTKVLVSRIVRLINSGSDPSSILVLAFNRKAALQLEERLGALSVPLGQRNGSSSGVVVATLNAFAFRLLKAEGWSGEILDDNAKEARLIRDALQKLGTQLTPMRGSNPIMDVLQQINRIKRGLLTPSEEIIEVEQPKGMLKIDAEQVWNELQDLQSRRHQISFEDQVFLAADLLLRDAEIRHRWQGRFEDILVDEFQDLNSAQSTLIRSIVTPSANLFAVGDDDQLIYSWRNAEVKNLLNGFVSTYAGATTYTLGTNYRCAKEIVRSGQRLIEHNKLRFPKKITPAAQAPLGNLELVSADSLAGLGENLVRFVKESVETNIRLDEICVLARTNTQLLAAALALDKAGLPRAPLHGVKLYSTSIGKRLIAYLDTCHRVPLFFKAKRFPEIVNRPNRFVANVDLEQISSSVDPWLTAQFIARDPAKKGMRTNELLRFLQEVERLAPDLHGSKLTTAEKVRMLAFKFRFAVSTDEKKQDREKATDEMIVDIIIEDAKSFKNLFAYLEYCKERLSLEESSEKQATTVEPGGERVSLSTIHAAKGREWSSVCLFDASKPSGSQETNPKDLEEERRVFYVGMTRASMNLQVGFVRGRPVQFISEAFLPNGVNAASLDDYTSFCNGVRRNVETIRDRLQSLKVALELNQKALYREKDGFSLREALAKFESMEANIDTDSATVRQMFEEAKGLETGGLVGRLFLGQVSPVARLKMMDSASAKLQKVEERRVEITARKKMHIKSLESEKLNLIMRFKKFLNCLNKPK